MLSALSPIPATLVLSASPTYRNLQTLQLSFKEKKLRLLNKEDCVVKAQLHLSDPDPRTPDSKLARSLSKASSQGQSGIGCLKAYGCQIFLGATAAGKLHTLVPRKDLQHRRIATRSAP